MKRTALAPMSAKRRSRLEAAGLPLRALSPTGKGIARGGRLKPVNRERRAKRFALQFGDKRAWIAERPCAICFAPGPSDPHHVRSRGAGGKSADLVPLCRRCHADGHAMGWKTFGEEFGVELGALAAELEADWQQMAGAA